MCDNWQMAGQILWKTLWLSVQTAIVHCIMRSTVRNVPKNCIAR